MSDSTQPGAGDSGVKNTGPGTINITRSAVGDHPVVWNTPGPVAAYRPPGSGRGTPWHIGVITVLSEETSAVAVMMARCGQYRKQTLPGGLRFHEACIGSSGRQLNVVATQALDRGQRSAVIAFEQLRQHYAPPVVALVGIAGGINPAVRIGDVVVVQDVIYYDVRRETPTEVVRRGQSRPVPAATRRAINDFFSDRGEPYRVSIPGLDGTARSCAVLPGPIGSGEAVVADKNSAIRRYIATVNDKTLALETEAGGVAEAFYELADTTSADSGWLAVRGISDNADPAKDDSRHHVAAWHAAQIFRQLLPYLTPGSIPE
jgi:adenosylhomocysteine nucleosidase